MNPYIIIYYIIIIVTGFAKIALLVKLMFINLFINYSEDLSELKYTLWCLKETMRMYPPVYRVYRRLPFDTDICGYTVPKGI